MEETESDTVYCYKGKVQENFVSLLLHVDSKLMCVSEENIETSKGSEK